MLTRRYVGYIILSFRRHVQSFTMEIHVTSIAGPCSTIATPKSQLQIPHSNFSKKLGVWSISISQRISVYYSAFELQVGVKFGGCSHFFLNYTACDLKRQEQCI